MAEQHSTGTPQDSPGREIRREGSRGGREAGGFRIRLSENELRAAQAVQEAFQLRSTVAALGFSIRTIAQLLEQGQLDALVAQQRASAGERPRRSAAADSRPAGSRAERRVVSRPDPFARPHRPQVEPSEPEPGSETEASPAPEQVTEQEAALEVVISEPDAGSAAEETSGTAG